MIERCDVYMVVKPQLEFSLSEKRRCIAVCTAQAVKAFPSQKNLRQTPMLTWRSCGTIRYCRVHKVSTSDGDDKIKTVTSNLCTSHQTRRLMGSKWIRVSFTHSNSEAAYRTCRFQRQCANPGKEVLCMLQETTCELGQQPLQHHKRHGCQS